MRPRRATQPAMSTPERNDTRRLVLVLGLGVLALAGTALIPISPATVTHHTATGLARDVLSQVAGESPTPSRKVRVRYQGDANTQKALKTAWDRGELQALCGQISSLSHGMNFQYGGKNVLAVHCKQERGGPVGHSTAHVQESREDVGDGLCPNETPSNSCSGHVSGPAHRTGPH